MNAEELLDSRILIVDDQRPNVLLLEKMLAAQGYQRLIGITDPREVDALMGIAMTSTWCCSTSTCPTAMASR